MRARKEVCCNEPKYGSFIRCEENEFVYFSLHDVLLDEERLETDSSFLLDGFHLHVDELIAGEQVQALLFERAYKAAKAFL